MLGQAMAYEGYMSPFHRSDSLHAAENRSNTKLKSGMSSHGGPVETQHQSFMNGIPNRSDFSLAPSSMGSEIINSSMMDIKSRCEGKPEDLMQELAKLAQSTGTGGNNSMLKAVQKPEQFLPVLKQEPGITATPVPPHPPPPPQRPATPTLSPCQRSPDGNTAPVPEVEAEKEVNNLLNVALANKACRTVHGSPYKEGSSLPVAPLVGNFAQTRPGYSSQVPSSSAQISPVVPSLISISTQEPTNDETDSKERQDQSQETDDYGNDEPNLYIDEGSPVESPQQSSKTPNNNIYQRSKSEDVPTSDPETTNPSPVLPSQTENGWVQHVGSSKMESSWDTAVSTTQEDGTERYYCHLCSYVGTSQYLFKAHMNSHFEHNCPHCDYTSRTEGRLKKHIKDFHTENEDGTSPNRTVRTTPGRPKLFRCKQCEFVSSTKEDFWNHSRIHIKSEKILQCPKCPFVTEYKHHLEYHLRNHFGSKPFKCEKCNYSCVNKSMLNSHMKSHTNVYQYRCADCTYATKYCHSLKLHLHKYNHKPATVLNLDGSLPVDGSGDFDLVSKRGPPRGPRGTKQDQLPTGGPMKGMLPQMGINPMNGAMMPGPFWPLMGPIPNGLNGPPPLIPVTGMNPLNMNFPGNKLGSPPAGAVNPGMPGMKCNWCDFITHSPEKLNMHILKVHAAEHQDLFSMFGIRTEALMEEQVKQAKMMMQMQAANVEQMKNILGSPKKGGILNPLINQSPQRCKDRIMGSPDDNREYQKLSIPESSPKPKFSDQKDVNNKTAEKGEHPLDLSQPYPLSYDEDSSEMRHEEAEPSGVREGKHTAKRPITEDNSEIPVRKRSRKGKAYKLDTLCRRLHEKSSLSPTQDEPGDDYPADYTSEGIGADQDEGDTYTSPNSTETGSQDDGHESDQQKDLQSNLNELHASICALNGDDQENIERSYETKEDKSRGCSLYHQNDIAENGHAVDEMERYQKNSIKDEMQKIDCHRSKFECDFCDIIFKDCVMYTMHMGYHGYKDPFKCNMCGHQSGNKVEFFLHIARAAHE